MRGLLLLLLTLTATVASAEDDYGDPEENSPKLEGTSRISMMGGWRYAPNFRFYDTYYFALDNRKLERSRGAIGGPLLSGTFAYSVTDFFELGIDLFASYERMSLTNKPGLNAIAFGALIGMRFQKRFEIGPAGLIPSVGALVGPMFAGSYFDQGRSVENSGTALGLCAGATLRLNPTWGVTAEFRQIIAQGAAEDIGSYNAGGSYLVMGVSYVLPWEPSRKINGRL